LSIQLGGKVRKEYRERSEESVHVYHNGKGVGLQANVFSPPFIFIPATDGVVGNIAMDYGVFFLLPTTLMSSKMETLFFFAKLSIR
jgi:hypothetical protein